MNAQELFIDSVSGRFMDGVSASPIENPTFFSNETRYVKCNVIKVRGGSATPRPHAKDATYFMRIGTPTQKLADGVDPTTAPPVLITAKASVVTSPASGATGTATVITYSPVTATFSCTITTATIVTAQFASKIFFIPPVTATVTATISTATISTQTYKKVIKVDKVSSDLKLYGHPLVGQFFYQPSILTFSPVFSSTAPVVFSVTVTLNPAISAYVIKDIEIPDRGLGYPTGEYALNFTSVCANDIQAVATASVQDGYINNIQIGSRGEYQTATAPVASLFSPESSIVGVKISSEVLAYETRPGGYIPLPGNQSATSTFRWALGQTGVTPAVAPLIFSRPTASSTTLPLTAPSASIEFIRNEKNGGQYYGLWRVRWGSDGYGYATVPTISHAPVTVSNCKISRYYSAGEPSFVASRSEIVNEKGKTEVVSIVQPASVTLFYYGRQVSQSLAEELNKYITLEAGPSGFVGKTSVKYIGENLPLYSRPLGGGGAWDAAQERSRVAILQQQFGKGAFDEGGYIKYDPLAAPRYISSAARAQKEFEITDLAFEKAGYNLRDRYYGKPMDIVAQITGATPYPTNFDSATGKFIDTRFGVQIEFEGVAPLFVEIDPVGKLGQKNSTTIFELNAESDSTKTIIGKEQFYENRIEYLTINGSLKDNGRQFLAVLATPQTNPQWQIENRAQERFYGGGLFDAEFSIVDFGKGYNSISQPMVPKRTIPKGSVFENIYGLINNPIFNSSSTIGITIPTGTLLKKTILTKEAETGTKFQGTGIQHFISDPGFGYTEDVEITVTVTAPVTSGILTSAVLTNTPSAYEDGLYECAVQSPPTGIAARVKILFDSDNKINGQVFIENSGYGYTSIPIITAPAPNLKNNGLVNNIYLTNSPKGYFTDGRQYDLSISASPEAGGDAFGYFRMRKILKITTYYSANSSSDKKYTKTLVSREQIASQFREYNLVAAGVDPTSFVPIFLSPTSNIIESFQTGEVSSGQMKLASSKVTFFGKYKDAKARIAYNKNSEPFAVSLYSPSGLDLSEISKSVPVETEQITVPPVQELSSGALYTTYADVTAKIEEIEYVETVIVDGGSGYTTPPTVLAPTPEGSDYGKVTSVILSNTPVGYLPNFSYDLSFSSSPSAGGDADGYFTVQNNGSIVATITTSGSGYLTPPTISAQGPNAIQGYISKASVTTHGVGYSIGDYQCSVTTAPSGGETAEIVYSISGNQSGKFIVLNSGRGYVTAPIITVPTPSGNIISSITVTCGGSYYDNNDAKFTLSDTTGQGCALGSPVISAGEIISIPVISGGYNYSNNPLIEFESPLPTEPTPLELSEVEGKFNITTASANAILGTASTREINLEVYETDGLTEQVVVQGKINLSKRIP